MKIRVQFELPAHLAAYHCPAATTEAELRDWFRTYMERNGQKLVDDLAIEAIEGMTKDPESRET